MVDVFRQVWVDFIDFVDYSLCNNITERSSKVCSYLFTCGPEISNLSGVFNNDLRICLADSLKFRFELILSCYIARYC